MLKLSKIFSLAFCLLTVVQLKAQIAVNFTISTFPRQFTPLLDTIYVAGDFNQWNPGKAEDILVRNSSGAYTGSVTFPQTGTYAYKFTRGNWASVESAASGLDIANRSLQVSQNNQQVSVAIAGWKDYAGTHTANDRVFVLQSRFRLPNLNRTRRLWVYLPAGYETSNIRYPVVYMHDGQNLFTRFTAPFGEWEVDERMSQIIQNAGRQAIVIGVDHGGSDRIAELTPHRNAQYGGGRGDLYARDVLFAVKPFVDSVLKTNPSRINTAVWGSSLGGLISTYMGLKYPELVGRVGAFSPSYWFSDSIYTLAQQMPLQHEVRWYIMGSQIESSTMVSNMQRMSAAITNRGERTEMVNLVSRADGAHSEWFWAREFTAAYNWLWLQNPLRVEQNLSTKANFISYPNPVDDKLFIEIPSGQSLLRCFIYSLTGEIIKTSLNLGSQSLVEVDTSDIPKGVYFIELNLADGATFRKKIVKN